MIDYDSKFEKVIEDLEDQEWFDEIEDDDKYLYYNDEEIEYEQKERR